MSRKPRVRLYRPHRDALPDAMSIQRPDGWRMLIRISDFPSLEVAWEKALVWFNGGLSPYHDRVGGQK